MLGSLKTSFTHRQGEEARKGCSSRRLVDRRAKSEERREKRAETREERRENLREKRSERRGSTSMQNDVN